MKKLLAILRKLSAVVFRTCEQSLSMRAKYELDGLTLMQSKLKDNDSNVSGDK